MKSALWQLLILPKLNITSKRKKKKKKKREFTYEWPFNLLLRRNVFTSFGVNLIVSLCVCNVFISVSAAFMCRVLRPEPTPYLPQLFWRRLCSFHTSRRRNGTPMLRLHRPDTLWPWRSAVSAASWKETQTQKLKSRGRVRCLSRP